MTTKSMVTGSGFRKLEDDLNRLKGKEMREALAALAEARDKGDISENSEYEIARENINMLNIKISVLEEKIRNSVIVYKEDIDCETAQLFSTIKVKNTKTKKEHIFHIVTDDEIDAKKGKISHNSPIAKGLIGKSKGDKVEISVPAGLLEFKILDISFE
jgi:transcription elongation factor GreA